MSHRAHKLNRKLFTEVKYENSFLIDFYGTGSLLATTAIDIQWPSDRMWLLAWLHISILEVMSTFQIVTDLIISEYLILAIC